MPLVIWNKKPIKTPEAEVFPLFNPINPNLEDPNLT